MVSTKRNVSLDDIKWAVCFRTLMACEHVRSNIDDVLDTFENRLWDHVTTGLDNEPTWLDGIVNTMPWRTRIVHVHMYRAWLRVQERALLANDALHISIVSSINKLDRMLWDRQR